MPWSHAAMVVPWVGGAAFGTRTAPVARTARSRRSFVQYMTRYTVVVAVDCPAISCTRTRVPGAFGVASAGS